MAIEPIPAFPALSDRADGSYNSKAFAWASHMADRFVGQANQLAANLNSIAAGGAYALPYIFNSPAAAIGGAVGMASGGHLGFSNEATVLLIDTKSLQGVSVKPILSAIATSSSAVKGTLRIVKQSDPSTWAIYNITSYAEDAGGKYGYFAVSYVLENGLFAENDNVILHLQRTGDKGDTGPAFVPQRMYLRDQKATGTAAQVLTGGSWIKRTINTAAWNDITGASLANDEFTLPSGRYWIEALTPALHSNAHKCRLVHAVSGGVWDIGSTELSGSGSNATTKSRLNTILDLPSGQTYPFKIEHFATTTSNGGFPSGAGHVEIYTEVTITKIA